MPASPRPYHLEQLAVLCSAHPVERKVVFVPSAQIGHNLGSALAAAGKKWINLYLVTPAAWAEQLAGPSLRASGWRQLVQDADFFYVHGRMAGMAWPPDHPFASGFSREGVTRIFLRTLHTLRSAEVHPEQIEAASLRYGSLLRDLYGGYCEWLEARRFYDQALLFAEAADLARGENVVAILDETPLSPAGERFVTALAGGEVVRIGRGEYGMTPPQRSAADVFSTVTVSAVGAVAPGGRVAGEGLAPEDSERIELRGAIGAENEVRGVLRRILADRLPVDSVEMAYTAEDPYLTLILDIADRLGLPVSSAAGVPATLTAPGQSLLHFFRWIASGHDPSELIGLCRSRLLSVSEGISSVDLGRILEEARVRRRTYLEPLDRLASKVEDELSSAKTAEHREYISRRIRMIGSVSAVVERLFHLVPPGEEVSLAALCEAGIEYIAQFAPIRTERDSRTIESIHDRLKELAESADRVGPSAELAGILANMIAGHKVEASVARPGHLYVVPINRAGYTGRSRFVVVGMAESTFPGVSSEDPILLDEERGALSGSLALARSRASEPAWHLVRAMGMAKGSVTLTSTRRSLSDGRETYPSALYQQIAEQLGIADPPIDSPVPESELASDEVEIVLSARSKEDVIPALLEERRWLAFGRKADLERRSLELGRFHGWLGAKTPELRPAEETVISVSRLEDLASCPYRYFLKHVLGIRPPEVQEEVPGRWLAPLEFGSLLHAVLREFMETLAGRGEKIDAEAHASLLDRVLQRHIAEMREVVPVEYENGYRADLGRLKRAAVIFLNEEAGRDVEPVGFEVSFGMGGSEGLNVPDPVPVQLSNKLRLLLRGSIDRVDRTDAGYQVWDYKTGSTFDFDESDLLSGGRRLQWALYSYVLEEILARQGVDGRTSASGYFFTSDRENGLRMAESPPDREALAQRIEPLFDLVENGAFLHMQKTSACKYCDFNGICASERREEKELEDISAATPPDRPFMEPLRRWMS